MVSTGAQAGLEHGEKVANRATAAIRPDSALCREGDGSPTRPPIITRVLPREKARKRP